MLASNMSYLSSLVLTAVSLVSLMGFIDIFVNEVNRCEMTYMYQLPQYVNIDLGSINKQFPSYHLYVYGEGQYADTLRLKEFNGNPVLFVPGNGGSYKQARSLASVALVMSFQRQTHLNYFTIDYNEELSAFIGDKLDQQAKFLLYSIKKILQLYNHVPNIKIILVGHSIGGVVIKAVLTKYYFKPYLDKIALIFTMATPHLLPAISYDRQILNFYKQANADFLSYRDSELSHINVISIGGSYQDFVIRPDLISLDTAYRFDRSLLTTAINDVWVPSDHLCIVWCRQLVIKLNQLIFDLIDPNEQVFFNSTITRQQIVDYHLTNRYFTRFYPKFKISDFIQFNGKIDWILLQNRLTRLSFTKIFKQTNYLIPLHERETIVLYIEGQLKHDMVGVCKSQLNDSNLVCSEPLFNIYHQMRLVPSDSKVDRHVGVIESREYLVQGYTHLVVHLSASSTAYQLMVDRFTTTIRRKVLVLPGAAFSLLNGGLFSSNLALSKLISQEQSFLNFSLVNLNYMWDSYWFSIETKACYQESSFLGFAYLVFPHHPEMNQYMWPLKPIKGSQLQFTLEVNRVAYNNSLEANPYLLFYLEPNCSFDVKMKFSFTHAISQLLRYYFVLLIPLSISIIILVLTIQFSNITLGFTCPSEELVTLKNYNEKCFQYLTTSEVMTDWRYFAYCASLLVPFSLLSVQAIARFNSYHDLSNVNHLSFPLQVVLCTVIFILAYSMVYLGLLLVGHFAHNFATGVVYFCLRWHSTVKYIESKQINSMLNYLLNYLLTFVFISIQIFYTPVNFYIVHFLFTIMMLYRYVKAKYVETKIGRSTCTSFIFALYPILFTLFLVISLLYIPHSVDWFQNMTLWRRRITFGHLGRTWITHCEQCLQLLAVSLLFFYLYWASLKFEARLKHDARTLLFSNKVQVLSNLLLLSLSLGNILCSTISFAYISYFGMSTFAIILVHISRLHTLTSHLKVEIKKTD